MPSPDVVQSRLDILQKSYPNRDRMDLQDALKSCEWNVSTTMEKLRNDMQNISAPTSESKYSNLPKKHRVKAHEAAVDMVSDSESESEEYRDNKLVYNDSDSDADEEEEVDEEHLPDDKKRVLTFFNNGTIQVHIIAVCKLRLV